ncbi:carboxypeptidase-like regulatory domain-containing protein [Pedobacter duraquae]|uniref:TonB-dependent SusC/RagA subfamily outer membrane receptor n=1 Tax=Pedobacter duraquae TaxID=425511 RepID=A0A4R6IGM9_9SPHI|nr:carboxypeptidase-like regulatory domain-containing protein [Pedobacter duraquae]TDO21510.1 TonB-dependent SusC/RagA subfamily outer membrane receptor [Pedobacter duraquae]
MLTKRYLTALTGICIVLVLAAFQLKDETFDQLIKKIETYVRANPQEKVYLHLDKPYYAVGDNIWFKSYILTSENDRLSSLSKILYVDLINEKDSTVQALTLPITEGLSWGNINLSDSLSEGNYRVRAYTQLMRNSGPEYFYDKTIKVGNAWSNQVSVKAAYNFKTVGTESSVASTLQFSNRDGTTLSGNDVRYSVVWNDKIIKSGSGKTNGSGMLDLNFNSPKDNGTGRILATVTMPDKKKVLKEVLIDAVSSRVDVQFFPEGGNMIAGLPGKVAIKAVNAAGKGTDVSGTIVDNEGNLLSTFSTTYLGMGNFILIPEPGKSYKAKVKFTDGSEQDYPLPEVQKSGYALSVNNTDSTKLQLKIYISADLLNPGADVNLLVQHNGNIYFTSTAKATKQIISASIPKKDLPSGVNHIVVVAGANQPVCERLAFISNSEDRLPLKLDTDQPSYKRRAHVTMNFSDLNTSPAVGSFSVAVTNADVVVPDPDNESNILTSLLLTSDLKGYVERPNHYFLNSSMETIRELDNLMLTQGWSRFSWRKMLEGSFPQPKFDVQKTFRITGTINTLGGKPLPNGRVSLFSSTKGFFMVDTVADANGRFVFDKLSYPDSTNFIVQGKNIKGKNRVEIKVDPMPGQVVTKNKNTGDLEINVNETLSKYIQQSNQYFDQQFKQGFLTRSTLQLNEVKITQKKKNPTPNSANLNGAGNADAIILSKDMLTCITLVQCLQGKVAGLMFTPQGEPYLMRNNGKYMAIYIDGIQVQPDFLASINVPDVESVEVLKSGANTSIYGMNGGTGVLIITTKRGGGGAYTQYSPWIVAFSPKGYSMTKDFYSPKYTSTDVPGNTDLRTTVYWNPNIISDASGKGKFDFYTSDQPGNYRAVFEGINLNGKIARQTLTFQVK